MVSALLAPRSHDRDHHADRLIQPKPSAGRRGFSREPARRRLAKGRQELEAIAIVNRGEHCRSAVVRASFTRACFPPLLMCMVTKWREAPLSAPRLRAPAFPAVIPASGRPVSHGDAQATVALAPRRDPDRGGRWPTRSVAIVRNPALRQGERLSSVCRPASARARTRSSKGEIARYVWPAGEMPDNNIDVTSGEPGAAALGRDVRRLPVHCIVRGFGF